MKKKIQEIIDKIQQKSPVDVKDVAISAAFIAALIAFVMGKKVYDSHTEPPIVPETTISVGEDGVAQIVDTPIEPVTPVNPTNVNTGTIEVRESIEVGDDGVAHTVRIYTEVIDAVPYTNAATGEINYVVPSGYTLKTLTDENGNERVVGVREWKENPNTINYAPAGSSIGEDGRVYTTYQVPTMEYTNPETGEVIHYAPGGAVMNGDNAYVTTVTDPMQYNGDVTSVMADSYVNPHNGDTIYDIPDDAIGVQTQIGEDGEKSVVYYQHR